MRSCIKCVLSHKRITWEETRRGKECVWCVNRRDWVNESQSQSQETGFIWSKRHAFQSVLNVHSLNVRPYHKRSIWHFARKSQIVSIEPFFGGVMRLHYNFCQLSHVNFCHSVIWFPSIVIQYSQLSEFKCHSMQLKRCRLCRFT